jgi:hypothetical protein
MMEKNLEQISNFSAAVDDLIKQHIHYRLGDLVGCTPCAVVTVHDNLEELRIDVQPLIQKITPDGETIDEPVIYSIPVIFPSTSTSAVTMPISVGDSVLCIFSRYNTDTFKSSDGEVVAPNDYRSFDYRDCFAIPCVWPFKKSINNPLKRNLPHSTTDLVVAHNLGKTNEIEIRFTEDAIKINAPYNDVTVDCMKAEINAVTEAKITAEAVTVDATTIALNGVLNINGSPYAAHTHGYVNVSSPAVTTPPIV